MLIEFPKIGIFSPSPDYPIDYSPQKQHDYARCTNIFSKGRISSGHTQELCVS